MEHKLGLYIHVPFCISKCDYCDFYSLDYSKENAEKYVEKIISELNRWGAILRCPADTLYFGGGTPSLLSAKQISRIIEAAKKNFVLEAAEITLEVNPKEDLRQFFIEVKNAGVNRISVGFQSGVDRELCALSRRHKLSDALRTVEDIKAAGIENFSLDLMLGIPYQTNDSLRKSLEIMTSLEPAHISAYLLSVEKGTPFYKKRDSLDIADDETAEEYYLETCNFLKEKGFERYEISNFCKSGKVSRHNLKYWQGADYLGLGPAAHSRIGDKRFYYDKNLEQYLLNPKEIFEGVAGDFEEQFMLNLRLSSGICFEEIAHKYNGLNYMAAKNKADLFVKGGLMKKENNIYSLTDKGALVSNTVILELLEEFGQKK